MANISSDKHIPEISSLRALAVLAVILYHMDSFPFFKGGFIGVDIFFVISGYVISRSIYTKQFSRFSQYLAEFYARRMKRILPALTTCLLVTMLTSALFIPFFWRSNLIDETGLSAFFGCSNFTLVLHNDGYFSPNVEYNPFLHTWSLAVEEQFYLLFPIIFYIWLKFGKNKTPAGFISRAALVILAIFSLGISIFETTAHYDQAFYLLPSRFWELAAGALLFQLHSKHQFIPQSKKVSRLLLTTGLLLMAVGFVFAKQQAFPFPWVMAPVAATMLLLIGIAGKTDQSSLPRKFLNSSAMTYIGKISYSLYLWHWPVVVLLKWTVGCNTYWFMLVYLAVTFVLANISYRFIEKPVLASKFLIKQKNWRIITSGIVLLLIVFSAAQLVVNLKPQISLSVTKDSYIWVPGKYEKDEAEQQINTNANIAGRKLFALGDSHTAAYKTMLNIISSRLGIETYEYEAGDCAVAGLLKPMNELGNCYSFYENSLSEIKKLAKPGDIVFLASLRMPELSGRFDLVDIPFVLAEFNSIEASRDRQLALEEADHIIDEFEALGLHVLFEAPLPVLKAPPFRCSDWFNKMNPIGSPGLTISRDFLLKIRQPVMDSLSSLQKRHKDLYVWDPFYVLCDKEEFSAYDDNGLPIFYDGDHLSANGNRMLAPSFQTKILSIWGH